MKIVCGIGNVWRGDDGAGIKAAEMLKDKYQVFICNTYPENFVDEICRLRPEKVIIIDAADFGAEPGTFREIDISEIDSRLLSTHTIPLSFFVSSIKRCCQEVVVYGIQVKDIDFRDHLSPEVRRGVRALVNLLMSE